MNTKLTLSLDKEVIEQAKAYAKERGMSLSKFVENFLKATSSQSSTRKKVPMTPIVNSLRGTLPNLTDEEMRQAIVEHLEKKHG
ncbi:MAG: DUF6364 family protein [Owenweeksia sp.]|nr:DUF6364 family protein [Owenweeksia sp.]